MACGIYKITNLLNEKSYIGQSINITRRWKDEKCAAFNNNSVAYNSTLSKAFRKYGLNNFSFEILEECSQSELDKKEQYYVELYDTYYNGYNETIGGSQSDSYGYAAKISKEDLLIIYNLLINTKIPQKDIAQQFSVGEDVISTINNGKSRRLNGYNFPLRNNVNPKKYCCDCGKELKHYTSIRCPKCEHLRQRVAERPNREELKQLIRTTSFLQIGTKYGVSDNAIRKWCKAENLPYQKKVINSYSDEEWKNI